MRSRASDECDLPETALVPTIRKRVTTSKTIPLQSTERQGRHCRALAAYKDFVTLWKDADPDVPILKEAKTEYAKLQ